MFSNMSMKICLFLLLFALCEKKVLGDIISDNPGLEALIQSKIEADGHNGYLDESCDSVYKTSAVIRAIQSILRYIQGIRSCGEAQMEHVASQNETGGIFKIYQPGVGSMEVYCDTTTDQGGWTVFQRRMDGSVDFYRNWADYVAGFGNKRGEFWLGLENIHQMTKDGHYELRIDMIRRDGRREYAKYQSFSIGAASDNYRLSVSGYTGNGSEEFLHQNGMSFTTKDRDHDQHNSLNCAIGYIGAWWYRACHWSNLNGKYGRSGYEGVRWGAHTLTFTETKFRKRQ